MKTEKLDKGLSKIIKSTYYLREKSDYDDFYIAGKEETKKQLQNAQVFVTAVEKYLTENSRDWVVEKSKQYYYDKISDKNYDAELLAQGIPA